MKDNGKETNKIPEVEKYKIFEIEFDNTIDFLKNFTDLVTFSGRIISFISTEKVHIVNSSLLESSIQTLKSIKLCCSIGSFSDANTLIRKLRDDLLQYVYILAIINRRKTFTQKSFENFKIDSVEEMITGFLQLEFNELTNDELAVEAWLSNKVLELPYNVKKKLGFENYMKILKLDSNVNKILLEYKLHKYWEHLQTKLNNYVHNNGTQFSQHNLIKSNNPNLEIYYQNINIRSSYVITFFLVLITMIDSPLLCSGDIEDYLDLDIEPPENCQYEIAPFIQEYINNKVVPLHPELKEFLQKNNSQGMKIE